MKIQLSNTELSFLFSLVQKTKDLTAAKNPKPQDTSGRLLEIYTTLLEKVKWVVSLPNNEGPLTLNRVEAKTILMQMDLAQAMLLKTKEIYDSKDALKAPFADKEGRRKEDYLLNIKDRLSLVDNIKTKVREAL